MIFHDLPTISKSSYLSNTYSDLSSGGGFAASATTTAVPRQVPQLLGVGSPFREYEDNSKRDFMIEAIRQHQAEKENTKLANTSRRIVKVIIIDPDDRVPLEKCILYSGDEKLTDLTDQELFFEIEIKSLLDKHNEYRKTIVDKKVKERTENLDPIKIRDLRMVVVDVAKF